MPLSLEEYRRRRDFDQTPEPRGSDQRVAAEETPLFVVQKHDSDLDHFDFRLQIDGVLKSWVVPEGLPDDVDHPRLALQMEDYPLEYADFEGTIPADQYGSGTIELWDRGACQNLTEDRQGLVPLARALAAGSLVVRLNGTRLRETLTLQRTEDGDEPRWLLARA